MKGFNRENQLFSLCGLNCGLCPMQIGRYCPGCGGGPGNQACKIAKCSLEHGGVSYCFECGEYPCGKYDGIDGFDSFITHKNQISDMEKAREQGMECYNGEQEERRSMLDLLLGQYDDGRKKSFYCMAVNLLDLQDLRQIMAQTEAATAALEALPLKEKCAYVAGLFQNAAKERAIELKLRKRP